MSEAAVAAVDGQGAADTAAAVVASTGGESQTGTDTTSNTDTGTAGADSVSGSEATDSLRPEGLPDEFWDGKAVKTGDLWNAYQELKTSTEAAKADVPDSPDGYELKLSDEVKVPEGFAVEIDAKDPFFTDVTKELHALGVGKAGVQKLVDAYARQQIAEQTVATETYAAEKAKLGDNAATRLGAVDAWLKANLTTEEASALIGSKTTAAHVRALEKIISLRSGPNAGQGGGVATSALEGLRGEAMLDAARAAKAA